MRPADLLAHQADLVRRYGDTNNNPDIRMMQTLFSASWLANQRRKQEDLQRIIRMLTEDRNDPRIPAVVRDTPEVIGHFAQMAMPIKVEPNMVDLVTWVAEDFADTEVIDMGLAPGPFGLVFLEKPLVLAGPGDLPVHIDWMLWGQSYGERTRAMATCGFNDAGRPDPLAKPWMDQVRKHGYGIHPYNFTYVGAMADGQRVGPIDHGPTMARPVVFDELDDHGVPTGSMSFETWTCWNTNRWLYALWVVMNQEIADINEEHADRATKRRMARMRLPPAISVIKLRRPANPHRQHEEGHVEWQHCWYVRPHPRWQAYGPGRSERKLIWIPGHWKGDLDKPISQSTKVYRVAQ